MSSKPDSYPEIPGKSARVAADACSRGDWAKAERRLHLARADREIFHPALWRAWARAPDELFARAASQISPEELVRLRGARDADGACAASAFSGWSERKLAALAGSGLALCGAASSALGSEAVEPAIWLAWAGDGRGLSQLMAVGAEPPGPLTAAAGARLPGAPGACGARSALHILACQLRRAIVVDPATLVEVVAWLGRGAAMGMRVADGRDALGLSIDLVNPVAAVALLEAGADPRRLDAKGRDALALLDRRARALDTRCAGGEAEALRALRPRLLAAAERAELGASAQWAARKEPRSRAL